MQNSGPEEASTYNNEGRKDVWNAGTYVPNYTASHHRRLSNNDRDRQLQGKLVISAVHYIHFDHTMNLYYVV